MLIATRLSNAGNRKRNGSIIKKSFIVPATKIFERLILFFLFFFFTFFFTYTYPPPLCDSSHFMSFYYEP